MQLIRRPLAILALGSLLLWSEAALAVPVEGCSPGQQAGAAPVPPEKFAQSPGGVDMRSGKYLYSHTDLSIGGEQGGLTLERIPAEEPTASPAQGGGEFGGLGHNWRITVVEKRVPGCTGSLPGDYDYMTSVNFGARSQTFRAFREPATDDFFMVSQGAWAALTFEQPPSGAQRPYRYTYRAADGTVVEFRPTGTLISGGGDDCAPSSNCAYASDVIEPDGKHYVLSYDTGAGNSQVRLRSVVSNRGFALLFEYDDVGTGGDWVVTKSCVLNLAETVLPSIAAEQICPAGVSTSTYTYASGKLSNFVDQGMVSSKIEIGASQWKFYHPGETTTPFLTNSVASDASGIYVTSQSFVDGRSYAYTWDRDSPFGSGGIMGGSFLDNNGETVEVRYGRYQSTSVNDPTYYITPSPELIRDELGREIVTTYCTSISGARCEVRPPQKITQPEGDYRQPTYGDRNNIEHIHYVAKPGSGDAARDEYWEFGCVALVCQNKPTQATDANGNDTDYVYDTTHGGLLKQTGPADAAGVHPQTRYTYAQRYAWVKASGSGYQQAASQVWLLTSEEYCRTSSADTNGNCAAGSSDEVVTTYDYGPNSGPNNLWLRGQAVTSNGVTLRTCYAYDSIGRMISETEPNANLSSCP